MRPNLEHLRKQAKTLLYDLRAGNIAAANAFIEHLPAARSMTPADMRGAGFRLADAQLAIARQSGFDTWPGLARHVEQLRALEGEWTVESLEVDGQPVPAALSARSKLHIDGDLFRMESSEATYEGVFNIDIEQHPPHIDIEFVEGPEAGQWSYGIYTLDGDALTFCLGLVGSSRPAEFATSVGSGHALERLRRISNARPVAVTGGERSAAKPASPAAVDESAFQSSMTPLLERLQGEWIPTMLVTDGRPMEQQWLAFGRRSQRGNETKVVFGGQTMLHARMRIDETRSPLDVDYLHIGKRSPMLSFGIMELDGDDWRVCTAPPGAPRPADFSCGGGSGHTLSCWKRKSTT